LKSIDIREFINITNPNIYKFSFPILNMVKKEVNNIKALNKLKTDDILIENLITLQKVLTDLSDKFDNLSSNISKLLELFESAAKNFAEKYPEGGDSDKDFLRKLDSLLEQNKTIAKGIMLMEEKIRNKPPMQPPQNFRDSRFQNLSA
jgi:hypothetical protein